MFLNSESRPDADLPCPAGYPNGALYFPSGAALANKAVWNTTHWFSEGVSSYHGLAVDLNRHWANGLQFRSVYTLSRALDDGDNLNTSVATNSPVFLSDPLRPNADYGRASFDVRQSGVIQVSYDLPFGRPGSALGESWKGWLVANWQVSGIVTLQSGLPFTPQLSYNPSNDGDTRDPVRPSWNPNFNGRVILGGPNEYFSPLAFIQPLAGMYGNAGRNILEGPSLKQFSLALAKHWSLSERVNLQFRSDFQLVQSHESQYAEPRRLCGSNRRAVAHGGRDYLDFNNVAPGTTGVEAALVTAGTQGTGFRRFRWIIVVGHNSKTSG